jgi:hypothetical protein
MDRVKVRSTTIRSIGYDPDREVLEIEFKNESRVYSYLNVPASLYNEFKAAPSQGKFFHARIRDKFPTRKVR